MMMMVMNLYNVQWTGRHHHPGGGYQEQEEMRQQGGRGDREQGTMQILVATLTPLLGDGLGRAREAVPGDDEGIPFVESELETHARLCFATSFPH